MSTKTKKTQKNEDEIQVAAVSVAVPEPVATPQGAEAANPNPVEPAIKKAAVSAENGLNLRRGPGLEVLKILPDGAELQMVEIPEDAAIEGWCPVITGDGNRGWVMDQYIRPLEG